MFFLHFIFLFFMIIITIITLLSILLYNLFIYSCVMYITVSSICHARKVCNTMSELSTRFALFLISYIFPCRYIFYKSIHASCFNHNTWHKSYSLSSPVPRFFFRSRIARSSPSKPSVLPCRFGSPRHRCNVSCRARTFEKPVSKPGIPRREIDAASLRG